MSQYVSYYLKPANGKYIPIGDFPRNSKIYQYSETALIPYGDITAINSQKLVELRNAVKEDIRYFETQCEKYQKQKQEVFEYRNSVEEKHNFITSLDTQIEDVRQDIQELISADGWFLALQNMQEAISGEDRYDSEAYLFAGIEYNPNAEN